MENVLFPLVMAG